MKTMQKLRAGLAGSLAVLGLALLFPISNAQAHWAGSAPNIVQRLERDGRFTTLLTALEVAGLKGVVATGGTFTVFAPTDDAFAALPPGTVESLVTNVPALTDILLYHVLADRNSSVKLLKASTATTLQGNPVLVTRERFKVFVNQQRIIQSDRWAANGTIHVVGGVLLPPAASISVTSVVDVLKLDGRFNTLLAAVDAAGLSSVLATGGPFTLFAPTDAAFAALPPGTVESLITNKPALTSILLYHVLGERKSSWQLLRDRTPETLEGSDVKIGIRGANLLVNDSRVINPDINTPNAVIHTIDKVLLPPPPVANLYDTLKADGRFNTLIAALDAAGLAEAVKTGELTIFAPTDAAFDKLPEGTVAALLANVDALKNVLLYHVVSGDLSAAELLKLRHVETLQGDSVSVVSYWGRVYVNKSPVLQANLDAANGQIHVIGSVLLPPAN
jgi:transforming growth factor-beta-induced protein